MKSVLVCCKNVHHHCRDLMPNFCGISQKDLADTLIKIKESKAKTLTSWASNPEDLHRRIKPEYVFDKCDRSVRHIYNFTIFFDFQEFKMKTGWCDVF